MSSIELRLMEYQFTFDLMLKAFAEENWDEYHKYNAVNTKEDTRLRKMLEL